MSKTARFLLKEIEVTPEMVDYNGHVNNVVYVQWMQDLAIAHAVELGFDGSFYKQHGVSWVARFHHIEYQHSAFEGDTVHAVTWIAEARKVACRRKYEFRRNSIDGEVLAQAETEWVFVDQTSGRPKKLLQQFMDRFEFIGPEFPA